MHPKRSERQRAREMRAAGHSVRAIARELGVALSSASVWTRDVQLPPSDEPAAARAAVDDRTEPRRRCSRCRRLKPVSSFNRHGDQRQWWCRSCFKDYYREQRAHHRSRNDRLRAERVEEARRYVDGILQAAACEDCGLRDPGVFEFDHVGGKRLDISTMIGRGAKPTALDQEISRCEIVCANCHRRRTASRSNWRRLDLGATRPFSSRARERNMLHCYCVLLASGCVDCRSLDLCALDFDHLRDKTMSVTRLAYREVSLARLCEEIRKCEVRCANCHRRRTKRSRSADTPRES